MSGVRCKSCMVFKGDEHTKWCKGEEWGSFSYRCGVCNDFHPHSKEKVEFCPSRYKILTHDEFRKLNDLLETSRKILSFNSSPDGELYHHPFCNMMNPRCNCGINDLHQSLKEIG